MNCAFWQGVMTLFWALALAPPAILAAWLVIREGCLEWGTTDREALARMAGDDQVQQPTHQTTLAVSIAAEPADVWPWLVQMGYRRGGLYSYDWLDRLFGYLDAPSAEEILPAFQRLKVGDAIPVGRGPAFPVTAVEPFRILVLGGTAGAFQWTWQFELRRIGNRHTRLISRNRASLPRTAGSTVFMWLLEPAAFIMTRKMLLGIKRRGESLAGGRSRKARHVA